MKNNAIKYRKIRGINRRKRAIKQWGEINKVLDVDLLNQDKRDYVEFLVDPWSRLSLINSIYPEPTGDCEWSRSRVSSSLDNSLAPRRAMKTKSIEFGKW